MKTMKELYEEALKEKKVMLKKIEPLREQEEVVIKELHEVEVKLKVIRKKIVAEEGTELAELSRIIAKLAPNQKKLSQG